MQAKLNTLFWASTVIGGDREIFCLSLVYFSGYIFYSFILCLTAVIEG